MITIIIIRLSSLGFDVAGARSDAAPTVLCAEGLQRDQHCCGKPWLSVFFCWG